MSQSNVLTIGLAADIATNHHEICQLLSNLQEKQCEELLVEFLLIAESGEQRVLPLLNMFAKQGVIMNKVAIVANKHLIEVTQVLKPDVIFTTNELFAEQLKQGSCPAVHLDTTPSTKRLNKKLSFAFDGDAVLFCHNAQIVANENGIDAFEAHEQQNADITMAEGPLYSFIKKIDTLQKYSHDINWSLVTARGGKALARAINTIENWQLEPNQVFFMQGCDKTPVLTSIEADIFFDDHLGHCQRASGHTMVGHVQISFD